VRSARHCERRVLREACALEDVARGAGVGSRFVSELERGKPTARRGEALRVAAALGVTIAIEDPDG
jgi:hypothetical protein